MIITINFRARNYWKYTHLKYSQTTFDLFAKASIKRKSDDPIENKVSNLKVSPRMIKPSGIELFFIF